MLKFNDNKAGMSGLDKEKIAKIIAENTSSNFGDFAKKKELRIELQCKEMKAKIAGLSDEQLMIGEKEMSLLCDSYKLERDLSRHCVHVDMDAFFAAVEMRDDPRLRTIPMAVGSMSMLSTSNYIARRFGVRAAMPGFIGKKLCPQLEIVSGSYGKYGAESKVFSAIFAEYDPNVSMGSLDEAYLDITDFMANRGEEVSLRRIRYTGDCVCRLPLASVEDCSGASALPEEQCNKCGKTRTPYEDSVTFGTTRAEVVREIRFRVEQTTGLTCSAGIAANFRIAKVCSDMNKPNGQYELANDVEDIERFLADLPIRKICGIGRVAEAQLQAVGISVVGDILTRRAVLPFVFSPLSCEWFLRIGMGVGSTFTSEDHSSRKSISVERTFAATSNYTHLCEWLRDISKELARQVKKAEVNAAKSLTVKMKLASFDVLTRAASISPNANLLMEDDIFKHAKKVLDKHEGSSIRLLGVRLSKLSFGKEPKRNIVQLLVNRPSTSKEESDDVEWINEDSLDGEPDPEPVLDPPSGSNQPVPDPTEFTNCPVCEKRLQLNEQLVNDHLDECLNRGVIGEILREVSSIPSSIPSPLSSPPSKRPRPTRSNTIHNYFTKVSK